MKDYVDKIHFIGDGLTGASDKSESFARLRFYLALAVVLIWGFVGFFSFPPPAIIATQVGAAFLGFGLVVIATRRLIARIFGLVYRIAPLLELWGSEETLSSGLFGGGVGFITIGCAFLIRAGVAHFLG